MSGRMTVALVAAFAGLVYAYWWSAPDERAERQAVFEAKRLFAFDGAAIDSIHVDRRGQEPIEAARHEDGWRITAPHPHVTPNEAAWERLAQAIAALTNERDIDARLDDTGVYGLDAPPLRLMAGSDGTLTQIDFGSPDPTQGYRYAQQPGGGIFLVPAALHNELNKTLHDLRDRRVFRAGATELSRIEYHAASNAARPEPLDISIEREPNGDWRLVSPIDAAASRHAVDALASEMRLLQGRAYIDAPEHLGDYGLDKPFASLSAIATDGRSETLHFGWIDDSSEDAGIFVQREGERSVFTVDTTILRLLPESVEGLREARLFSAEASRLSSIVYRSNDTALRLAVDDDGGWSLVEPLVDDTDQIEVSRFIALLKGIRAERFPDPDEGGGARETLSLDFEFDDGRAPTRIAVGAPVPNSDPLEYYAWQDNGTRVVVSFQAVMLLRADAFRFRDRRLMAFDARLATAAALTLDGQAFRFERDRGRWRVASPEGYYFESQDDARAILEALAGLRAEALAPEGVGVEAAGMTSPVLVAEVWVARPGENASERVGEVRMGGLAAPESRRRFTESEGRSGRFFVDQGVLESLRSALEGVLPR